MGAQVGMPEFGGIGDRLARLEQSVADLLLARRLESATIGGGNLTFDGGQAVWIDSSGNTLFTIDENGLITFEADGSQMSVLDAGKLRFNRADGTRQLEITPAGGAKFYEANGTTVLTTLDSSGVQVGTDVVIDSTGLQVIGGYVTPLWTFVDQVHAANASLTTTQTNIHSVTITPPAWVQTVLLQISHKAQISHPSTIAIESRLHDGTSPISGDATFQFNVTAGQTNAASVNYHMSITSFPFTVHQRVNISSGTNSSNQLGLGVTAFGIRN